MCLLNKLSEVFLFSKSLHGVWDPDTLGLEKETTNQELFSRENFYLEKKMFLNLSQILTKNLQTWMFIASLSLMQEKNVDHPGSIQMAE